MPINYVEKGSGLHEAIDKAGHWLCQVDNNWVSSDDVAVQTLIDAYAPTPSKQEGVEFEGVLCSATSADQSGLMAVLMAIQIQGASFRPTRFEFENETSLVIHLGNYQKFMSVWVPFRQSFFVADPINT